MLVARKSGEKNASIGKGRQPYNEKEAPAQKDLYEISYYFPVYR